MTRELGQRRPYWSAILDFYISPKPPKTVQINQKLVQINKQTLK